MYESLEYFIRLNARLIGLFLVLIVDFSIAFYAFSSLKTLPKGLCSLIGNWLYLKHLERKIKKAEAEKLDLPDEPDKEVESK